MLLGLRHHAVVGCDGEQHEIDAVRAGEHVADEALVAGDVDDTGAGAVGQREVGEAEVDRNPALLFFFEAVGVLAGERLDERGLAVIDMAGGADDGVSGGGHRGLDVTPRRSRGEGERDSESETEDSVPRPLRECNSYFAGLVSHGENNTVPGPFTFEHGYTPGPSLHPHQLSVASTVPVPTFWTPTRPAP